MKKEFKQELERAEGNTEQWCAVKRLEVSFDEFIKKLKKDIDNAQEGCGNLDWVSKDQALEIIDKLAGEFK